MDRQRIIEQAKAIYAEDGLFIADAFEDDKGIMFTAQTKDGQVDVSQFVLCIEYDGRTHYEAANGSDEFFFRYMDANPIDIKERD